VERVALDKMPASRDFNRCNDPVTSSIFSSIKLRYLGEI
jgi:hypothetical protein